MPNSEAHIAVALFPNETVTIQAAYRLHDLGVGNEQISVLALDGGQRQHAVRAIEGDPASYMQDHLKDESLGAVAVASIPPARAEIQGWAVGTGAGVLMGLGLFAVPGLGPALIAAGPIVMGLTVLTQGTVVGVGLGMLVGAIFEEVASDTHQKHYAEHLQSGGWLLSVHGDAEQVTRAAESLRATGAHVDTH